MLGLRVVDGDLVDTVEEGCVRVATRDEAAARFLEHLGDAFTDGRLVKEFVDAVRAECQGDDERMIDLPVLVRRDALTGLVLIHEDVIGASVRRCVKDMQVLQLWPD